MKVFPHNTKKEKRFLSFLSSHLRGFFVFLSSFFSKKNKTPEYFPKTLDIQRRNPLQKKQIHRHIRFSFFSSFFSFFSTLFQKKPRLKTYTFFSSLFLFSFFIFTFFHQTSIFGSTYLWIQTSWTTESSDTIQHPNVQNWNKYQSKDIGIDTGVGDSIRLATKNESVIQTTDIDFSYGIKSEVDITGSGDNASVGLLNALGAVSQVEGGEYHTCALKTDGTVYCWGRNNSGQLGDNTTETRYEPTQVLGVDGVGYLSGVLQISTGYSHTCAMKTDDTVYCWGYNSYGQLGDNTTTDRYTPVQVLGVGGNGTLTGVSQITVGYSHTCAIKTDGTAYCWGQNSYGQLGDNTTTSKYTPVQVLGVGASGVLSGVSQISAGRDHTCALKTDGTVYCWGLNDRGQLGDNTTTDRRTPVQVLGVGGSGTLSGVSQVSAGGSHTCALKTDDTVYCWDYNSYGQLGDNTTTNRYTPVQVKGVYS